MAQGKQVQKVASKSHPPQNKKYICRSKLINLAQIELKAIERNNRSGKTWIKMRRKAVGKDGSEDMPCRILKAKKTIAKKKLLKLHQEQARKGKTVRECSMIGTIS